MPLDALPRVPDDVSESEASALLAICGADLPWTAVAMLDETAVGALIAAGYLDRWDEPEGGPYVTLTAWGASRLRAVIRERERLEKHPDTGLRVWVDVPRWDAEGREPPAPRVHRQFGGLMDLPHPDLVLARPADAPERDEPGLCVDTWSGDPIELWGRPVPIDRRMRPNGQGQRKGKPPIDVRRRSRTPAI